MGFGFLLCRLLALVFYTPTPQIFLVNLWEVRDMKNLGYPLDERTGDFSATNYSEEIHMIDPEDNSQLAKTYSFPFTSLFYNIPYGYKVRTHRKYYTQHCVKVKGVGEAVLKIQK